MNRQQISQVVLTAVVSVLLALGHSFTTLAADAGSESFVKAGDSRVSFTGRVLRADDGSVSFDWVGVYMQVGFSGSHVSVRMAESDTAYYNVFVDGRWQQKIKCFGRDGHDVLLADRLRRGWHTVCLQRCTEGQYSRTTIYGVGIDRGAGLRAVPAKKRFIEFYGDSYTCGFGVESNRAEDPFRLSTENCNDAYACLLARYFDADYALVAHSGKGLVRNYGQAQQTTENLLTRHDRLFDEHDTLAYDFKAYTPDLVVVNLGTNDFSPTAIPTTAQYVGNYLRLLRSLRQHYGEVPVMCVTPHSASAYLSAALSVLRDSVAAMPHVHMAQPMPGIILYGYDLGASWHPNRQGHRKIAMTLIPQVSAITKWDVGSMDALLNYPVDRDWAQLSRYDADNARLAAVDDPERVVFLGNSITDFWPRRHADFWQQHPHYVCRGISGQTSSQFVTRFREDVINLKPWTVVINAGTNDIAENTGVYSEDVTFGNIVTMVELARLHNIRVVLSSVLPAKKFSWRPAIAPEDKIERLNSRIRQYARSHHIPYADYYSALVDPRDRSLKEGHSVDGVHPNARGYEVMERVVLPLLSTAAAYDLVVVGGNPGGIMAAVEAARMGKTSVILERTAYVGGLPANGLGATDIATRGATTGLFSEFTSRIRQYYSDTYGPSSQQVKDCSDGFHFEPSVAARVFSEMIAAEGDRITVLTNRQFNITDSDIVTDGHHIERIRVVNRLTGDDEWYEGRIFVDATYEGDLGAAAGEPFCIGREAATEYNEPGAGRAYEYWKSLPADGTTGEGDEAIQAYNYRLTLTDDPAQRVPFTKPAAYDRRDYVSLIEDVWTGRTTWKAVKDLSSEVYEQNRRHLKQGGERSITPWDMWGIDRLVSNNRVPNGKVDANNQHAAFISTDLPEENWPWPTASWEWRDRFAQRLRDYTEGLFWFAANDKALPEQFRREIQRWGYARSEYEDNGYFPRQVYVREGRRFEGQYFFTAKDALPVADGQRPPLHRLSITASHYALDSHAARKREAGRAHLDGFISYPTAVYTVPYGVIVPKNTDNLLLPVPVSGSHIGFSTLRMEPCWMALGQAAGAAAALAIDQQVAVQHVSTYKLQDRLIDEHATLVYFEDVTPADSDFALVQRLALKGILTDWRARLDEPVSEQDLQAWQPYAMRPLQATAGLTTRREVLRQLHCKDAVKVLAIGNSFSANAVEKYLHDIASEKGRPLVIGHLYIGGCRISRHVDNLRDNLPAYEYRKIDTDGLLENNKATTLLQGLQDESWDYVSVQQESSNSGRYDSYRLLPELLRYVKANAKGRPEIVFHQTWAYARNTSHGGFAYYGKNQQTMYDSIVTTTARVCREQGIETIIPCGPAIQQARSEAGDSLNVADGFHLNDRGRYVAAQTWYQTLFKN